MSTTTTEKLLSTREVGERIGGASPSDVLLLIRKGEMRAKLRTIRGKGKRPRKFVPESEVARYIQDLPDANGAAAVAVPKERTRRGRREEVKTEYY